VACAGLQSDLIGGFSFRVLDPEVLGTGVHFPSDVPAPYLDHMTEAESASSPDRRHSHQDETSHAAKTWQTTSIAVAHRRSSPEKRVHLAATTAPEAILQKDWRPTCDSLGMTYVNVIF
jgi:hypothetical protein